MTAAAPPKGNSPVPAGPRKRYIILHCNVFTQRDWERFGCETFRQRGYDVMPIGLAGYMVPGRDETPPNDSFSNLESSLDIRTHEALDAVVREFTPNDLILAALIYTPQTAPVYWLLKEHGVDYVAATLGKIGTGKFRMFSAARSVPDYCRFKFNDLISVLYRIKLRLQYLVSDEYRWLHVQPPKWWLDAGTDHAFPLMLPPRGSGARRIPVHSLDVETAKQAEKTPWAHADKVKRPFVLIIDSGFIGSPDFELLGYKPPVTFDRYKVLMNRLCERIEQDLGYDIVVAMHPKSNEQEVRRLMGNRLVLRGQTARATKECEWAIAQCSSSISYAVHYRKPLQFVTTQELEDDPFFGPMVARMSSWFGRPRLLLDNDKEIQELNVPAVDERCYQRYENAFLQDRGSNVDSIWTELTRVFETHMTQADP